MRVLVGGFGFQGLAAIPFIDAATSLLKNLDEIICNGIACLYASILETHSQNTAMEYVKTFLKHFKEPLLIFDRLWTRKKGITKKTKIIEYCTLLSVSESKYSWKDFEELFQLQGKNTYTKAEGFDLHENSPILIEDELTRILKASVAFPGLFPPLDDRIISTTYLSQIPVSFAKDGDVLLLNFRNVSEYLPKTADEFLAQAAEIRAISFAKRIIESKNLKLINAPDVSPEMIDDLSWFKNLRKDYEKALKEVI